MDCGVRLPILVRFTGSNILEILPTHNEFSSFISSQTVHWLYPFRIAIVCQSKWLVSKMNRLLWVALLVLITGSCIESLGPIPGGIGPEGLGGLPGGGGGA